MQRSVSSGMSGLLWLPGPPIIDQDFQPQVAGGFSIDCLSLLLVSGILDAAPRGCMLCDGALELSQGDCDM